jgi:multidrug efflux pump subunit AcrA (membrane-fusion protein)
MAELETRTQELIESLKKQVTDARAVPMSASCMINRPETLALLDDMVKQLKLDLEQSAVSQAYQAETAEADRIIAQARSMAQSLVSESNVVRQSRQEAQQLRRQAEAEIEQLRVEADRYVEARMAAFEAELQVTSNQVKVMRERLMARSHLEDEGPETVQLPRLSLTGVRP